MAKKWPGMVVQRSFINYLCTNIPGPFLPFLCLGLNLDWVKSYFLRCSLRLRASSANSQKIATDKQPFLDHIWPFFGQLHVYLSQNCDSDGNFEVLNESKFILVQKLQQQTQKCKKHKRCKRLFLYKISKKKGKGNIYILCHNC